MIYSKCLFYLFILIFSGVTSSTLASGTMTKTDFKKVNRTAIEDENDRLRLQKAAGLLAYYEIEAKKLVDMINKDSIDSQVIFMQAEQLLILSESIIDSARFRLPQCDEYLAKSVALKDSLLEISLTTLEKDYHLDGALPKAPGECYHTKDLFVHPASVMVMARDNLEIDSETKEAIRNEITEVLAHTEVVRQLVIY